MKISGCVLGLDGSQLTGNGVGALLNGNDNLIESSVLSGNASHGVEIVGNGNHVVDVIVGLTPAGDEELGNGDSGIKVAGDQNLIENNLISRNNDHGIWLASGNGNEIYQNYIGTDRAGKNRLGNDGNGVFVDGAFNSVIGNAGEGNLISGNLENGVMLTGTSTG